MRFRFDSIDNKECRDREPSALREETEAMDDVEKVGRTHRVHKRNGPVPKVGPAGPVHRILKLQTNGRSRLADGTKAGSSCGSGGGSKGPSSISCGRRAALSWRAFNKMLLVWVI